MTGFQRFVHQQPAPAAPGDFAGANPRASLPAPSGGFVAGTDPLVVGNFAWGNPDTGKAESNSANGGLIGFVHREQGQTIITTFLDESRFAVQAGFMVTLMSRGDFWADFGDAGCNVGDPVYANNTTGAPQTSSSGATITPFVCATSVPVPAIATGATIAVTTGIATFGAVSQGTFEVGQTLTWSGMPANTEVRVVEVIDALHVQTDFRGRPAVSSTTITGRAGQLAKISTWSQPTA